MTDEQRTIINEKLLIPVSLAAAFITVILGATIWLHSKLAEINTNLLTIRYQLDDTVTEAKFADWREELRAQNPSIHVPYYRRNAK